jgi:hypothetical protein
LNSGSTQPATWMYSIASTAGSAAKNQTESRIVRRMKRGRVLISSSDR